MVDFIVIGAHKSATTSVCDLLNKHPGIFISDPKEPNYFAHDDRWSRGPEWYENLFSDAPSHCLKGEGSTNYTMHGNFPNAPERIAKTLPRAKLIYLVRHPIERIESHWLFRRKSGWQTSVDINNAVVNEANMVDISLYFRQICFYLELFPEEQIHVELFEDFIREPDQVIRRICQFLDISDFDFRTSDLATPRNPSTGQRGDSSMLMMLRKLPGFQTLQYWIPPSAKLGLKKSLKTTLEKPSWRPEVRARLLEKIEPDARQFLGHFGKPLDSWTLD